MIRRAKCYVLGATCGVLWLGLAAACDGASRERTTARDSPPAATWPAMEMPAGAAIALAPGAEREWRVRALAHAPRYFLASGWADARSLWGVAGSNPVVVRVDAPEFDAWRRTAWDAWLAPGGERLAWINERGVWVGRKGEEPRLVLEAGRPSPSGEGDLTGPLLWSPDGSRLLVRWAAEWDATFGTVDVTTGEVTPLATPLEGYYLSDAFGWIDPHRILFSEQAVRDLQGRSEYSEAGGYRGDLAVYDERDGSYRRVTSVPDGTFLRPQGRWGERGVVVGEAVGDRYRMTRFWAYETADWTRRPLELPPGYQAALRDTTAAVIVDRERVDAPVSRLWLWRAGAGATPLALVRAQNVRAHWSPTGDRIAIAAQVQATDSLPGGYHNWVLEPRTP